jgi:endonuclease YncB( thermonuclease family)
MFDYLAACALILFATLRKRRVCTPQQAIRHSTLRGIALNANDSDNIRFLHIPTLFHLALHAIRPVKNATSSTLNIRLAGIDAPECAHWGQSAQPYSQQAKEWLSRRVAGKFVVIQPLKIDQYNRIVAAVWARKWLVFWECVSMEMVRAGFATVYTAGGAVYPQGSEGSLKEDLQNAESIARRRRHGMWRQLASGSYVSPAEHKRKR